MGYRVAWIARCGTSVEELLEISGCTLSGERHDFPDVGWYLLELPDTKPNPWVVLIAHGTENYGGLDPYYAELLSQGGGEALYYWCSDTVMVTELQCFQDGAKAWSIEYYCYDKTMRPAINGDAPAIVHEILKGLQTQQQADDGADFIYELTAEVGQKIVGFRHDVDLETKDPDPFQVLIPPVKEQHPWWQFWK